MLPRKSFEIKMIYLVFVKFILPCYLYKIIDYSKALLSALPSVFWSQDGNKRLWTQRTSRLATKPDPAHPLFDMRRSRLLTICFFTV